MPVSATVGGDEDNQVIVTVSESLSGISGTVYVAYHGSVIQDVDGLTATGFTTGTTQ